MVEPSRVQSDASSQQDRRHSEFAASLRVHTSAPVLEQIGFLRNAPSDGIVLLDPTNTLDAILAECDPALRASLPKRIVLLGADRSRVFDDMEAFQLAGAIEQQRYFQWRNERDHDTGGGLHGRKDLAGAIAGSCFPVSRFQSEHYCVLSSPEFSDLPGLLIGYLNAYCRREHLGQGGSSTTG